MDKINKLIKYPVRYDDYGQMIFDKENNHILDIRGWGRIQYMDNPTETQDFIGKFIANAINQKLENIKASKVKDNRNGCKKRKKVI